MAFKSSSAVAASTFFLSAAGAAAGLAAGDGAGVCEAAGEADGEEEGAVFADAEAYERLCRFYMATEDPLLLEAQREQQSAPGRGLGLQTGMSYPHGCGHTGFTGTGIYFSREADIGVVSFTNRLFYPQKNENATWEFRRALQEAAFALCGSLF